MNMLGNNYGKKIISFYRSLVVFLLIGYPGTIFAQYTMTLSNGVDIYISNMTPDTIVTLAVPELMISGGSQMINNGGRFRSWRISTFGATSRFTSTGEDQLSVANVNPNGIGAVFITGNGIFNFGDLVQATGGWVHFYASATCKTFRWATNNPVFFSSPNVTLTVEGGEDAIKNFGAPKNMFVLIEANTKLIRKISSVNEVYEFPIGYSNPPGPPFYQYVPIYRRIDIKPTSLGSFGPGYVSAVTKKFPTGTISYDTTFSTGFSNVGGVCYPGTQHQDVAFDCRGIEGWSMAGPDYDYVVTGYPPTPCGTDIRKLLKSPAGSNAWQANIEDVVGSLESSFCSYSTWGPSAAIMGGLYNGFGDFVAAGGSTVGLPVELISFDATPINNEFIRLDWQTAIEIDNEKFIVTRSTDGYAFQEIGQVAGNGNTTELISYAFDDTTAVPDIVYYYRFTQVDYDGDTANSPIVSAYLTGDGEGTISVFPNPTMGKVFVQYTGNAEISGVVYSALGDRVAQVQPAKEFVIDLQGYASGVYVIDVLEGDLHKKFKIVKTN